MIVRIKVVLPLAHLVLTVFSGVLVSSDDLPRGYESTRKLLSQMRDPLLDSDKLALLFRIGDKRVGDLIQALGDPDKDISLRAQVVLRYLGNDSGMKALRGWYGTQKREYPIAGPVPLPLSDWDFEFIRSNILNDPPQTWGGQAVQYIYALAFDDSQKAKAVLNEIVKKAEQLDESTFVKHAIKGIQGKRREKPIAKQKDVAKVVRDNAFFVLSVDRRFMSVRLLGFNGDKNKAIVEVHINRGSLAEEWYHVVMSKSKSCWKFVAIDPLAIS